MSKTSKLVAIALIAVVIVAGAGYWLFSPNLTSGTVGYTSEGTSLEVSRRTSEQTLTTSRSSAATSTWTTLSPNASANKPVSYYLGLLESNRTEPYVQLAKELRKLPDLSNTMITTKNVDRRMAEAVESMVSVVLRADGSERYAISEMLNEGIEGKRKFCAPLQAWLWVAYDRRDYNPLLDYSLDSLLSDAWLGTTTSNHFNSNRWSYGEARDRVNSPELVNWFISRYLTYDWSRNEFHPQDARITYELRRGVCRHTAYVGTDFLAYNGYQAMDLSTLWAPGVGHSVATVRLPGGIWIVVDFGHRSQPLTGPFKTYEDVAKYLTGREGYSTLLKFYVESNYECMERNNDVA
jgi:hypothetical protein